MAHRVTLAIAVAVALVLAAGCTSKPAPDASPTASRSFSFQAGAEGLGDSYFPDAGNGGYDVGNYALNLRYDPATDRLSGTAVITAKATQDLSQFNLDFRGLTTERVTVDGTGAKAAQDGDELVVTPAAGLPKDAQFTVEVRYAGVPKAYEEPGLGQIGFLHTDDGAVAIGPAPGRRLLVPRQRPPARQGHLHRRPSPHRTDSRLYPTAYSRRRSPPTDTRRGPGRRPSRWPPTWPPS